MVYKIIKEILNLEDVSDKDKISMITEMTEKFEAIDDYAEEMAELGGGEGIVLHISDDFKPYVRVGQHYIYNKVIPPEFIRAVYSTTRGDLE